MSKRPRGYVIFLWIMVLLALLGIGLVIMGSATHTPLRQLFPGHGLLAQGLPL